MRLSHLVDPIARQLLELRTVSPSQLLLRAAGVVTTVAALLLAAPGPLGSNLAAILAALAVACGLLVQVLLPDSDLGVLPPLAIMLLLVGQSDPGVLRAAGIGLALLLAHMAFAIAATGPAHGLHSAAAWALVGKGALTVLAGSAVAGLLVVALMGVDLGPWMVVPGVLALIALLAVVLPRAD